MKKLIEISINFEFEYEDEIKSFLKKINTLKCEALKSVEIKNLVESG